MLKMGVIVWLLLLWEWALAVVLLLLLLMNETTVVLVSGGGGGFYKNITVAFTLDNRELNCIEYDRVRVVYQEPKRSARRYTILLLLQQQQQVGTRPKIFYLFPPKFSPQTKHGVNNGPKGKSCFLTSKIIIILQAYRQINTPDKSTHYYSTSLPIHASWFA